MTPSPLDTDGDGDVDDDDEEPGSKYEVDIDDGPQKLEFDVGDKAEILQDKSPSTETVAFLKMTLAICLKARSALQLFRRSAHEFLRKPRGVDALRTGVSRQTPRRV